MVCLGNICRSPIAEGILQHKIKTLNIDWSVDSAGTSGWHNGESPDPRAVEIAKDNQIDISRQKSRKITLEDLDGFDLILTMDTSNYQNVLSLATNKSQKDKIKLILEYVYPGENRAVPDPYFDNGFQNVFDLLDKATDRIIAEYLSE